MWIRMLDGLGGSEPQLRDFERWAKLLCVRTARFIPGQANGVRRIAFFTNNSPTFSFHLFDAVLSFKEMESRPSRQIEGRRIS